MVEDAKYQIILSVLDDDRDRYARLISTGIKTNDLNVDDLGNTKH